MFPTRRSELHRSHSGSRTRITNILIGTISPRRAVSHTELKSLNYSWCIEIISKNLTDQLISNRNFFTTKVTNSTHKYESDLWSREFCSLSSSHKPFQRSVSKWEYQTLDVAGFSSNPSPLISLIDIIHVIRNTTQEVIWRQTKPNSYSSVRIFRRYSLFAILLQASFWHR